MFFDTHCFPHCFGLAVGVALLSTAGLVACDKQPAAEDVLNQTQQPVAEDAVTAGDAAAQAQTVRKVEELLDHTARAQWAEASLLLEPYLADPAQRDVEVWSAAGRIALLQKKDNVAAFAAEAIGRLRPDYGKDEKLKGLMAELHVRPIAEKVKLIPEVRKVLAEVASGGGTDSVDTDVMNLVGNAYVNGLGVSKDRVEAMKWYRKAAAARDPDAMYNLGMAYYHGDGVEQNLEEAVKWFRKAADGGDARAMNNLGVAYDNGQSVQQNGSEAVKWYRKAAEGGNAWAMFNLGQSYAVGDDIEQDSEEAVKWWRMAAEGGYSDAMFNLGVAYHNGDGVEQNLEEAVKWSLKAAEGGDADAMYNIGIAYYNGEGVGKDDDEAVKWLRKSAKGGGPSAQAALRQLGVSW